MKPVLFNMPTATLKCIVIVITALAITAIAFVAPVPQDPAFHQFADHRAFLSIPNCWNVLSNIGFLLVGATGMYRLLVTKNLHIIQEMKSGYLIFFMGIMLVAFGSGYYHWNPNNHTLIWDRLPMTVAFMALMTIAIAEYLSINWGRFLLWPLLLTGAVSVCYWYWGELRGVGDLRPYFLVQFLPMVLLPVLLVFGKPTFQKQWGYWLLLLAYVLAKFFEHFDSLLFTCTAGEMAGHAIKHLLVVAGLYALLVFYGLRKPDF